MKNSATLSSNTRVTLLLCGRFGEHNSEARPLNQSEFHELDHALEACQLAPENILDMTPAGLKEAGVVHGISTKRLTGLMARDADLEETIKAWSESGIWVLGERDKRYPARLRQRLISARPPLLFGAGAIDFSFSDAVPEDGRDLKCGSCDHVWLYKVEDVSSIPLTLNENVHNNEIELDEIEKKIDNEYTKDQLVSKKITDKEKKTKRIIEKQKSISEDENRNNGSKFFSYLIVFIITLIALVILVDTLKTPLINTFPSLEVILFNLFETLKDIKLFIIDLY